jgi:hypothetical protein
MTVFLFANGRPESGRFDTLPECNVERADFGVVMAGKELAALSTMARVYQSCPEDGVH